MRQNVDSRLYENSKPQTAIGFYPCCAEFCRDKSDTIKLQGINHLAAAERGVGIYDTERSV